MSSVKRYEKIIQSRKSNEHNSKLQSSEEVINDDGNLMEELLKLKMSAENRKSVDHASSPGKMK